MPACFPFLDLHAAEWTQPDSYVIRGDARRFENWESYVAGRVGLGVAVDYALTWGLDNIWKRVTMLAGLLRERLAAIPGVTVQDKGFILCGIVTFTKSDEDPVAVKRRLRGQGINASVSSSEYARFDMEKRGLSALVRASVHYYNTEAEVEHFCAVIESQSR